MKFATIGGNVVQGLQKELVEKILLIPVEDDGSSVERALEIINQLGEDHINDIITVEGRQSTALGYVIIANSQGDNPRISERPRINNRALVELENAIRNVGGRTSEELGLMQNIPVDRETPGTFLTDVTIEHVMAGRLHLMA